jgi:hypothetical protein
MAQRNFYNKNAAFLCFSTATFFFAVEVSFTDFVLLFKKNYFVFVFCILENFPLTNETCHSVTHLAVSGGDGDGKLLGDSTHQHRHRCHPLHTEPPSGQIQHFIKIVLTAIYLNRIP